MDDEEPTFTTCGHTNILLPSREAAKASSQDKYVYGFHHIGPSSASARSPTRRAGEPPSEFDLMFKYMLDFSFPIVQTPPVQATTPLSEKEMELCWQLYERGGRIARGYFPDDSEQYCPEEGVSAQTLPDPICSPNDTRRILFRSSRRSCFPPARLCYAQLSIARVLPVITCTLARSSITSSRFSQIWMSTKRLPVFTIYRFHTRVLALVSVSESVSPVSTRRCAGLHGASAVGS